MDSTVGLAMSIKEIKAIIWDLQAQAAAVPQAVHGTITPVPPPPQDGSVDPPLMLDNACTTRFQLPNGLLPTF